MNDYNAGMKHLHTYIFVGVATSISKAAPCLHVKI